MLSLKDILNESNYLYTLVDEYYSHIDRYKNQTRDSLPVRYMSINLELSVIDNHLDAVYQVTDNILNDLVFDVYELVPTKYSSPINPELMQNEQFTGLDFNLPPVSITILGALTSDKIHLNDLVQFYSEYFNKAIFQVYNIRTPLITNFKVPIFELDLTNTSIEYDKLYEKVKVNKIYIYDYSLEKFVEYEFYQNKTKLIDFIENFLIPKINSFFDYSMELYTVDGIYFPKEINELVYKLVDDLNKNYFRINNLNIPTNIDLLKDSKNLASDEINLFKLTDPLYLRIKYDKSIKLNIQINTNIIDENISNIEKLKNFIQHELDKYSHDKLSQLYFLTQILDYIVRKYVYI